MTVYQISDDELHEHCAGYNTPMPIIMFLFLSFDNLSPRSVFLSSREKRTLPICYVSILNRPSIPDLIVDFITSALRCHHPEYVQCPEKYTSFKGEL